MQGGSPYINKYKQEFVLEEHRQKRADAQFRKLQREEDGRKAMMEYEANIVAVRARTARLRELRLAQEAAQSAAPTAVTARAKSAKPARKAKA
jgi:hypothetical protein